MSSDDKPKPPRLDAATQKLPNVRTLLKPSTLNVDLGIKNRPVMPFNASAAPQATPAPQPAQTPASPDVSRMTIPPLPPPPSRPTPPPPPQPAPPMRKPAHSSAPPMVVPDKRGNAIGAWRAPGSSSGDDVKVAASSATQGTALAFSNAAAGAAPRIEENPTTFPREDAARAHRGEGVEIIGFDAAMLPRMRKHAPWKKLLSELNPKAKGRDDDADDDGRDKQKETRDRRDVLAILMRGESTALDDLRAVVWEAMENLLPPPLVLVSGEIELCFDEMETLKAALAVISPFVGADKKLKEALDAVRDVMATPGIDRARTVVDKLCGRVRDAFGEKNRGVPATYIESQTEPMLLEARAYQKRVAFGKEWIRASLLVLGDDKKAAIPVYIATDLSSELPMIRRFPARLIAEVRARVEQSEANDVALKVVAMGRRVGR
ncbi:MAG: hypothetical protein IPM54_36005 [Polyangiaceae bacterium]|nr:hypothetical protein [Polyangiaceae bacterium]